MNENKNSQKNIDISNIDFRIKNWFYKWYDGIGKAKNDPTYVSLNSICNIKNSW